MIATIAGKMVGKFKCGLTLASGALGRAGEGCDHDRAEHKASDAGHGRDKALPAGQALAFGLLTRAKGRVTSARERLITTTRGAAAGSPPPTLMRVNLLGRGYQGQGNAAPAAQCGQRRGQIVRRKLGHDARLHWDKRSWRIRFVICLFRILVSKAVPAIRLKYLISSFFHEERKPLSGPILRW
jgi:hypothetical protein